MKLSELFGKDVVTASADDTVADVAKQMQEHNVGAVVIVEGKKPVGIVTDRDIALSLGAQGISPQDTVDRVMVTHIRTFPDDAGIYTACKCLRDYEVRRLPIVDKKEQLVGIVTLDDLLAVLGKEIFSLAEGIQHEMEVK
jgi:CBS domain-containing protein